MYEYIRLMKIFNHHLIIFKITENVQGSCHLKLPCDDNENINTNEVNNVEIPHIFLTK